MNTYEVKCKIRQTVTVIIAVLSLFLGNMLFQLSNLAGRVLAEHLLPISSFLNKWEYLGVIPSQITVSAVFVALNEWFDKYLWRIPIINRFLGVPNLNGLWKGTLESSYQENGANKKIDMILQIEQTWSKMKCTSIFSKSKSYSDLVCLDFQGSRGTMLKFTYTNYSEDFASALTEFAGYNELRLDDTNKLSGTYYTKRNPSTRGTISLVRITDENNNWGTVET